MVSNAVYSVSTSIPTLKHRLFCSQLFSSAAIQSKFVAKHQRTLLRSGKNQNFKSDVRFSFEISFVAYNPSFNHSVGMTCFKNIILFVIDLQF